MTRFLCHAHDQSGRHCPRSESYPRDGRAHPVPEAFRASPHSIICIFSRPCNIADYSANACGVHHSGPYRADDQCRRAGRGGRLFMQQRRQARQQSPIMGKLHRARPLTFSVLVRRTVVLASEVRVRNKMSALLTSASPNHPLWQFFSRPPIPPAGFLRGTPLMLVTKDGRFENQGER